jgi:hypothetical protein
VRGACFSGPYGDVSDVGGSPVDAVGTAAPTIDVVAEIDVAAKIDVVLSGATADVAGFDELDVDAAAPKFVVVGAIDERFVEVDFDKVDVAFDVLAWVVLGEAIGDTVTSSAGARVDSLVGTLIIVVVAVIVAVGVVLAIVVPGTVVNEVDVVDDVKVVDVVDDVEVVDVVGGALGSGGPEILGVPMNSKCIPSMIEKLPPHANPFRRNTSIMRESIFGTTPYGFSDGLISIANAQLCRDRFLPCEPLVDRISRTERQPP